MSSNVLSKFFEHEHFELLVLAPLGGGNVGKISWGACEQRPVDTSCCATCLRAFLRYLMSVDHLKQLMGAEECVGRVEAYVERNNDRKSLSGCVILVDRFPTKAFTRQQSSVAMSSAEAELIAITEGAKEAVGVVALVQHIYGPEAIQDKLITLTWVRGAENPADIFTKALGKPQIHHERLGIVVYLPRQSLLVQDLDFDQTVLCSMLGRVLVVSVLERFGRQLDEVNLENNRWVVVEFCTSVNSGMQVAAEAFKNLKVVCVTEEENGLSDDRFAEVLYCSHG
eukprot:s9784_g1.t1